MSHDPSTLQTLITPLAPCENVPVLAPSVSPAIPCTNHKFASAVMAILKGFRARVLGQDYNRYPILSSTDAGINETVLCDMMMQEWWIPVKNSSTDDYPYSLNLTISDISTDAVNITMHTDDNECKSLEISLKATSDCRKVAADMRSLLRFADILCSNLSAWISIEDRCDVLLISQCDITCRIYFPRSIPSTGNMLCIVFREDPLGIKSLHAMNTIMRAQAFMENGKKHASVQSPIEASIPEQQREVDIPANQLGLPFAPVAAIEDENHITHDISQRGSRHGILIVDGRTSELGFERLTLRDFGLNSGTSHAVATVESSDV
jgi:hypothetical protein